MRKIVVSLLVTCLLLSVGFISIAEEATFEMNGKIHELFAP